MSSEPLKLSMGFMLFQGPEKLAPALEVTKAVGITEIDSAEMYGTNEADLGTLDAGAQGFVISTKNYGGWKPGEALKAEKVRDSTSASLKRLNLKQMDIYYIHGPDDSIPLEEWVPIINEQYKSGLFRRLGVSNFSPEQVRALYDFAKKNNYVLPTVYQGNYNPISRSIESTLFPVLRELGIAFYAYSPIAGGFLTKSRKDLEEGSATGRFDTSGASLNAMYRGMYMKPSLLTALDKWEALAGQQGVPKAELAYRWIYYHSALKQDLGDTVIVGASKTEQIKQTVEGLKRGPLKGEVANGVDEIWELVKDDAILDNFAATMK